MGAAAKSSFLALALVLHAPAAAGAASRRGSSAARAERSWGEFEPLHYFNGTWRCEAMAPAMALQPGAVVARAYASFSLDFERSWLSVRHREQGEGNGSAGYESVAFWGLDRPLQRFLTLGVGSRGDHETATSSGWRADSWVWMGQAHAGDGTQTSFRRTFVRLDNQKFTERYEVNVNNVWRPAGNVLQCRRL